MSPPPPPEWDDGAVQKPPRAEILRLIYRGRFLHESTKLSGRQCLILRGPIGVWLDSRVSTWPDLTASQSLVDEIGWLA